MTTEYPDEAVLELDSRRRIYEVVKKHAGSHFREIERKADMPAGTVRYHLSYLSRHGLIKEEKDGRKTRFFPRELRAENQKLLGLLRQKSVRDMILTILSDENYNHERIVKAVGISPPTVSWHLKKLEECGVIESKRAGRNVFYRLLADKEEIIKLLITYRESFVDELVDRVIEMWG